MLKASMEPKPVRETDLLATLPPEWPEAGLRSKIRAAALASGRKIVVLDDDPTGTQTVHDLPVLTQWTPEALDQAWDGAGTTFYLLTNSRRYPLDEAASMNREIARNLAAVARARGTEPLVVSRSDSTLRGHYPGEVSALQETLEQELGVVYDGLIIAISTGCGRGTSSHRLRRPSSPAMPPLATRIPTCDSGWRRKPAGECRPTRC